ncbi:MAG: 5-bromo-4-chloroindolyl phosphate hydrolysis family protein [Clostridia bacterium]|nr:5-bromo-4-chloroindolyl phosphate hydrolysis family protein [Clostridia bacterium]
MSSRTRNPKRTKGLGAGIIAFGAVFAVFSAVFHPHTLGGYILAFVLSFLFGAVVKVMGEGLDLSVKEKQPDSLKNIATDTGNSEVDALLAKGRLMITELHDENKLIEEPSLTDKLTRLESQTAEVFRAVYDKPAKAGQIRKFMDYYLPTTLKLVKGYRMLGERNEAGQGSQQARSRIDEGLGVVLQGCQKMLDNLYRDDVLDLTTDIDVLEQMLKRDGLAESELQRAALQAKQAAWIDRQVDAHAASGSAAGEEAGGSARSEAGVNGA